MTTTQPEMSANRAASAVFGILWLAGGGWALVASRHVGFTDNHGVKLLGQFAVNGLRGSLMVAVGLVLVAAALAGPRAARRANLAVGIGWLVLDLLSVLVGDRTINVVALHDHAADILLIAGLGLVAVALLLDLPPTSGTGRKYRTVSYGQGARTVDADELPPESPSRRR